MRDAHLCINGSPDWKYHALQPGVLHQQPQESRHGATGQGCKDGSKDNGDSDSSTDHNAQKCCCEKAA